MKKNRFSAEILSTLSCAMWRPDSCAIAIVKKCDYVRGFMEGDTSS